MGEDDSFFTVEVCSECGTQVNWLGDEYDHACQEAEEWSAVERRVIPPDRLSALTANVRSAQTHLYDYILGSAKDANGHFDAAQALIGHVESELVHCVFGPPSDPP